MYVIWKDGMTRLGGGSLFGIRSMLMFAGLLAVAWLVALLGWRGSRWGGLVPALGALVCAGVVIVAADPLASAPWLLSVVFSGRAPTSVSAAAPPAPGGLSPKIVADLRTKTVNAIPWAISWVVENHLRWDPMPIAQTYSAYTPYLDHLDARQLASPSGASRIVVSFTEIDRRYLVWDPPAVWGTVLSRYSCSATQGESAVLDRSSPRWRGLAPIGSATAHLGQWLSVPTAPGKYEFADIDIASSPVGAVAGLLFRQTPIFANLRLSNGQQIDSVRVVAGTAGDGLYLSHFIASPQALCSVLNGSARAVPRIVAIRLFSPHPIEWSDQISVHFESSR